MCPDTIVTHVRYKENKDVRYKDVSAIKGCVRYKDVSAIRMCPL